MKKIILTAITTGLLTLLTHADILVSYNTVANLGTETTEPTVSVIANLTATALSLGGITPAANGNRFGGSGWFDTGNTAAGNTLAEAIAGNDYIQFTITPDASFSFTLTSFAFIWDRSGTGPSAVTLRSSFDSFATDLGSVTGLISGGAATTTVNTMTVTGITDVTSAITFRLYGTGATGTGGTGGFDTATAATDPNVVVNGTVTAAGVPEPSTYAMLFGGIGLLGLVMRRKRA